MPEYSTTEVCDQRHPQARLTWTDRTPSKAFFPLLIYTSMFAFEA
jgi:hypothetical protein